MSRHAQLNAEFQLDNSHRRNQILEPSSPIVQGIPTLAMGVYKTPSEMLEYRFRFAGSWKDAIFGVHFLNLQEMEGAWTDPFLQQLVENRKEYWEDSPLKTSQLYNVSLFGVNRDNPDEVYLMWEGGAEPWVLAYISNLEERFDNLADFILFYCQ